MTEIKMPDVSEELNKPWGRPEDDDPVWQHRQKLFEEDKYMEYFRDKLNAMIPEDESPESKVIVEKPLTKEEKKAEKARKKAEAIRIKKEKEALNKAKREKEFLERDKNVKKVSMTADDFGA